MNPAAAAAHPEYEFSIDTTTGMSPPPIAATRCSPSSSAITVMISSGQMLGAARYQASSAGADDQRAEVQPVPAGQGQRRRLHLRRQLQVRDDRAGEGDRADEHPEEHLDQMHGVGVTPRSGRS